MNMLIRLLAQFPDDADAMLLLQPEELAGPLLNSLKGANWIHRYNSLLSIQQAPNLQPAYRAEKFARAIAEAWAWLEQVGLLVAEPIRDGSFFISRRGLEILEAGGLAVFRQANAFPSDLLHPTVKQEAWASFLRGRFDTAVFEAFREVEVAVRAAAGLDDKDVGTDLMRKAFDKNTGALTDRDALAAEREALAHLFAGAIGSYKNPVSHRKVGRVDAREAGELLMLASHLMRIVDDRATRAGE